MIKTARAFARGKGLAVIALLLLIFCSSIKFPFGTRQPLYHGLKHHSSPVYNDKKFCWTDVAHKYNVTSVKEMPASIPNSIPKIQHVFGKETTTARMIRLERLAAVKGNFTHAWKGYKDHAWLRDEVQPISAGSHDPFGGWAATLVDSLG